VKSYLISSTKKSSGKTIIATGLCSVLSNIDSLAVFKKGPDYIDPLWLSQASKAKCYNLDFFTMTNPEIRKLYKSASHGKNISIVEGNKGLFDGVSLNGIDSNASLAHLLKLEVILVLDCSGITRGIAPLLQGYKNFDSKIKYKGIILNNIASERHEGKIINAVNEFTIFKVSKKQLGHMKIYRNEWVLMYCYGRHRFTHNLLIVPLEKRVTVKKLNEIKVFRK